MRNIAAFVFNAAFGFLNGAFFTAERSRPSFAAEPIAAFVFNAEGVCQFQPRVSYPGVSDESKRSTLKELANSFGVAYGVFCEIPGLETLG
jgi:hypothetical protein